MCKLCEKHKLLQKKLYYIFIDFRKALDKSVATVTLMKQYNIDIQLINIIQSLYENANNAVIHKGIRGDWFQTKTGERQGCLLSPTLFYILLENIMNDAKYSYRFIKDKWPNYYKSPLSDDICGFTGSKEELIHLRGDRRGGRFN